MKTLKKHWKWAALAAVIVLLIAIFTTWRPVKNPATQEYIIGSGNCRGQWVTDYEMPFKLQAIIFALGVAVPTRILMDLSSFIKKMGYGETENPKK